MEFNVPQFIERESKIAGPLTFKQFFFLGSAGLISFICWFIFSSKILWFLITIFLGTGALFFAFLRPGGKPLPVFLLNFFNFFTSPKIYIWKKRTVPPRIIKREKKPEKETVEVPTLRIAEKSQLKKLATQIETQIK